MINLLCIPWVAVADVVLLVLVSTGGLVCPLSDEAEEGCSTSTDVPLGDTDTVTFVCTKAEVVLTSGGGEVTNLLVSASRDDVISRLAVLTSGGGEVTNLPAVLASRGGEVTSLAVLISAVLPVLGFTVTEVSSIFTVLTLGATVLCAWDCGATVTGVKIKYFYTHNHADIRSK